jgi:hypothetical protein
VVNRIADRIVPVSRTAWFGWALLAAVVATTLVSAGEARAGLINGPATCEALFGQDIRVCIPTSTENLRETLFTVRDENDPLFNVYATETRIILAFVDPVTGNDLDDTGFKLSGLESMPDLIPGPITAPCLSDEQTNCVRFLNFNDEPITRPSVSADGTFEWTRLTGMDPQLGSIAIVRLNFVPELGTAALLGLGLGGLGVVGRSRRGATHETA